MELQPMFIRRKDEHPILEKRYSDFKYDKSIREMECHSCLNYDYKWTGNDLYKCRKECTNRLGYSCPFFKE